MFDATATQEKLKVSLKFRKPKGSRRVSGTETGASVKLEEKVCRSTRDKISVLMKTFELNMMIRRLCRKKSKSKFLLNITDF